MKSHTNEEMADMNDDKWLVCNGTHESINKKLILDVKWRNGAVFTKQSISGTDWERTVAYRLHNGDGFKDGIAIEQKATSTKDKLLYLLNNNEAMEVIALEACLEQQKLIDKAKDKAFTVAAAAKAVKHCKYNQELETLYDAGMLSMPEGDK